jgi:hypothetical protein
MRGEMKNLRHCLTIVAKSASQQGFPATPTKPSPVEAIRAPGTLSKPSKLQVQCHLTNFPLHATHSTYSSNRENEVEIRPGVAYLGRQRFIYFELLPFRRLHKSTIPTLFICQVLRIVERIPPLMIPSFIDLEMQSILMKWIYNFAIVSNICSSVLADTSSSFSPSCVPGSQQTAFPNCNHFLNFGNTCPNLPTDQAWKECLCNQDYINSLFGYEFRPLTKGQYLN